MDPRDLLRQKTLSNIKSTAQKLFNKGSQFIQENPSPAIYANKQFQSKVAQPFASGVKAAGRSYVEAIPAAIKLSPPAQLASAYQNYRTNVDPVQNLKTQGTNVLKSAPLVFGTAGAGNMARQGITSVAKNLLPNALIGGGISTATGGNFFEGAGRGVGAAPQISGVTGLTNPLINKTVGRLTQNIQGPVKNLIANRIATGLLNMPEGAIINSALGREGYGLGEAALDFGTGALFGAGKSGLIKGSNNNPISPGNVRRSVDAITEHDNLLKEPYSLKQSGRLKNIEDTLRSLVADYIDKDFAKNASIEDIKQELFNRIQVDTAPEALKMGIYGGPQARNFPQSGQGTFSSMADKKMRFEIDDSGAKLISKPNQQQYKALADLYNSSDENITKAMNLAGFKGTLPEYKEILQKKLYNSKPPEVLQDILDHPELYKQYPELKNSKLQLVQNEGFLGSYSRKTKTISITEKAINDKSVLLHEIQHAIQEKEGFARGGNAEEMLDVVKKTFKEKLPLAEKNLNDLIKKRAIENDPKYDGLIKNQQQLVNQIKKALDKYNAGPEEVALYKKLAGEVEARDVQARMNLTTEQRATILPYQSQGIPVKDQIVRFDGETQASVSKGRLDDVGKKYEWEVNYGEKTPSPKVLYHGTNNVIAEKIKGEGLKPLYEGGPVSLTDDPKIAQRFAELKAKMEGGNPLVIKVSAEGTQSYKYKPDSYFGAQDKEYTFTQDEAKKLKIQTDSNVAQPSVNDVSTQATANKPQTLRETVQSTPTTSSKKLGDVIQGTDRPMASINPQKATLPSGAMGFVGNNQQADTILQEARKSIKPTTPRFVSLKDSWKRFYTDNVNRFQPVENLVNQIEKKLGTKIETSKNPVIQIMRLMGAGGTAEQRHRKVLDPILKQIPKEQLADFDVYLKARRDIGFGDIGRKVLGSDYEKAVQIKQAIEQKYDAATWDGVAKQLYEYQDQNLRRLVDEGFIDESTFNAVRGQNPDYVPFQRVMDDVDNFIGLPTRRLSQGPNPVKKLEGSERDVLSPVESIIADTYKMEAAVAKNRVAKTIGELSELLPDVNIKKVSNASQDTIPVWENGKKVYYEVPEDINKVVKGLNEEQQTQVVRLLSLPAQWLRQGATGRNIDFMIPNIIRDQFDAAVNSKYGYVPFVDYFNGLSELIKYKMGKPSLYEDWANSGGKIFYEMAGGRKAIAKEISDATKQKNIGKKFLGALTDGLDILGEFSETPTRLGLYKKAFQKTGDKFLAAQESREGTLDFARMGAKMKTLNAIIPFFNVGIQGFDKLMRTVKSQPQKLLLYGTLYGIAPQVALTVYNNTYFPEEYKEIADEVKQDNFVFVTGRNKDGRVNYVTLAKGNVLPTITAPVDNLLSAAAGYDRTTFSELALSLLGDTLPILESGRNVNQALSRTVGGLIPQAFKPAVEDIANYKFYAGKQIVPEYMKNLSPVDQAYDFTETPYKYLGNVLQVSPLRVKNFLEATLAGGIKVPMQVFSIAQKVSRGEQPSPNEIPVLRRFFSETYDTGEQFQKKQKKEQKTLANKEEAKKSIAPLQKRLFGEVSAATEQEPMPKPKTELQAIVQQSSKDSKALREYKEYLTGEKNLANPQDYFKENYGTTPEELDLKIVKSLNTVEQAEQVYQLMKKDLTEEKFAKYVKDGLLTDAVAKQFLETEKITKEQHEILKTLMDQVKTGKKAVAKVSKAKKKKLSKIKKIKFKTTPIKIKAPKVKLYKPTQIKIKPLTYKKEWMSKFGLL